MGKALSCVVLVKGGFKILDKARKWVGDGDLNGSRSLGSGRGKHMVDYYKFLYKCLTRNVILKNKFFIISYSLELQQGMLSIRRKMDQGIRNTMNFLKDKA